MFMDDQGDKPTCKQLIWNDRKDSWNLSLQTLGWGRYLVGDNNPLYQGMLTNDLLKHGYEIMLPKRIFLPIIF
jgi:hypothetical protein